MKTRLHPNERTVLLQVKVPESFIAWLKKEPGGISKAIRRLIKEERWRRAGKCRD